MNKKKATDRRGLTKDSAVLREIGITIRAMVEAGRPLHTKALIDVLTGMSQATPEAERRGRINTAIRVLKNQHARRGQNPSLRML